MPRVLFNICVCERKLILCVEFQVSFSIGLVWCGENQPYQKGGKLLACITVVFSNRRVADHFRVNHSIIVRLMQRFRQTGNVTDRPRAGRPRKTMPREDRLISRRTRQRPFSTAGALRGNLAFGGHISTRTVIRRLHHQEMRARRPIKRPQLTLRHRHARFDWSHYHLGWTIRTWGRVHWSDESRFLLRPSDGRARVWRQRNTSFQDNHILGTTAFGVVFPLTVSWTCTFLIVI